MEGPTFEDALEELKAIVQALEKGDRPLEESLQLFERGIGMVTHCTRKLDEADKKVELLLRSPGGELRTRPLEEDAGE